MKFEEHCKDSINIFGKPYEFVHKLLDEFAGKPSIGMKHRKFRHNMKFLLEIRNNFGEEAFNVAKRHVEQDLKEEGWKITDHFPQDENDYVKMGLF